MKLVTDGYGERAKTFADPIEALRAAMARMKEACPPPEPVTIQLTMTAAGHEVTFPVEVHKVFRHGTRLHVYCREPKSGTEFDFWQDYDNREDLWTSIF